MQITSIYCQDGTLCWDSEYPLATIDQYMFADQCSGSVFEALAIGEYVELEEGIFQLNENLEPIKAEDPHYVISVAAIKIGKASNPAAPEQHHQAFQNSVAYLVTGLSGGSFGPSVREHSVSWMLAGSRGKHEKLQTDLGAITLLYPDGTMPAAGQWGFEKAVEFASSLCYGQLAPIHFLCYENEPCFDDAPEDLFQLKKPSGRNEGQGG